MSHKITKHLMPAEEATRPTPCATDPERWFPDEQKPDPYAVAACWSCHFQAGCARRALSAPAPEHGVWGGYRLAPGPGLERTRAQLEIIAGHQMGPAASPGPEIIAAIEDLAGLGPVAESDTAIGGGADAAALDLAAGIVDLDDWRREPSAEDLANAAREELAALAIYAEEIVDARGQILLPIEGHIGEPTAAAASRRPGLSIAGTAKRAS